MEVNLATDVQAKLDQLAEETGRPARELAEAAIMGYLDEFTRTRTMLHSRYDDLKSGRVKPIDGEAFFENLRQREEELIDKQAAR